MCQSITEDKMEQNNECLSTLQKPRMNRLHVFLALFTFVYFLESIGGSYMISAVQNIERQFQIPSKLSGFLVSAHDISYVPTVIFISYFGSRGNRAKWIGAGTILIAFAHIFTASPNFFFPVEVPRVNLTEIEERLYASSSLLTENASVFEYFNYAPIRDRIPVSVRTLLLHKLGMDGTEDMGISDLKLPVNKQRQNFFHHNHSMSLYSIDEPLVSEILLNADLVLNDEEKPDALLKLLRLFVENRAKFAENDLETMRHAAIAPFAFCHKLVNDLRQALNDVECHNETSNFGPLLIIFVALLALGIGRTMPWTLGIPLIDDNVKSKSMPVYFAMISFIRIMGPICGFLIGSFVNKLYYTFPTKAPRGLTPQDPTWIGAWWLGFLFIGIITIIPSVILFFFPESPKRKDKVADKNGTIGVSNGALNGDVTEPLNQKASIKLSLFDRHVKSKQEKEQSFLKKIQTFLKSYEHVIQSKVYVGTVVGRVMDIIAFKGYMVFLPKYLENHYGIPQYRVHLYMAIFGVLGFACGTACGGFITRRFKMNGRHAALFVFFISTLNTAIFFSKSFLGCHSIVNSVGKIGADNDFNYTRSCNAECSCASAKLFPVCDVDGRVFYSPCHAGCRHVDVIDLDKYDLEFSECDCVPGGVIRKEYCHDDCHSMTYIFFVTVIAGSFVAGTGVVPGMLILLRSVPPESRSPALGLQGFLVSLLGTLPSPILWGAIIDSACLVWDNVCGSRGACQIYDPTKLRVRMHVLYVVIRIISIITDLYVYMHAKGLTIQDDEKTKEKTEFEAENAAGNENIALDVI